MNKKIMAVCCAAIIAICSLGACGNSSVDDSSKSENAADSLGETSLSENEDASGAEKTTTDGQTDDTQTSDSEEITPAMWKATGKDGATVTFIGSMHALYETDYPLSATIEGAFNDADILAVEADISKGESIELQSQILANMYFDDPTDELKNHISDDAYSALEGYFTDYSLDLENYSNMRPWAVYNIAGSLPAEGSGLSSDVGLDSHFLSEANESGKEIYEVESVEFQINMMMDISDEIYDVIFKDMKNSTKDEQVETMIQIHDAWAAGDTDTSERLSDTSEGLDEKDTQLIDDFNNIMLYDRNKVMVESAENFLNGDKNVFFVVGSAHYLGDKGIIALLEKDGYTVERIEY